MKNCLGAEIIWKAIVKHLKLGKNIFQPYDTQISVIILHYSIFAENNVRKYMQKTPDFPMPITTNRLIIRPTQAIDAKMLNETILESFNELHFWMEWANHQPDFQETEKLAKEAADNWVAKKNDEP